MIKKNKSRNQKQSHILFPVQVYILKTKVANLLRMGIAEVLWYFQTPVYLFGPSSKYGIQG